MKIRPTLAFSLGFLLLLLGCQKTPPPLQTTWFGTMTLADQKSLPFQVYLDLNSAAPTGHFINGSELTPIPELYFHGDSLKFVITEYGAVMEAIWDGKKFSGEFLRFRKDTTRNSFELTPSGSAQLATTGIAPEVSLAGKYQVLLKNQDGVDSSVVATFWTQGDSLLGTFIAPDGDYGLMAGVQSGNVARLGRFTGWQGQLMELNKNEDRWTGTLTYRIPPSVSFELVPRADATVGTADVKKTSVKEKSKPFRFEGVTVLGDTLRSSDARFKGKALIVDIMGTWCHNCMDAAPLLQKLSSDFRAQGLEVVSLAFEISDDFQVARKNLLMYQARYEIGFNVLFCGSTSKANVEERLRSQLNNFAAYPTTLFIDRRGVVQYIHEGFQGKGTGEEYQRQVDLYYDMARKLVGKGIASK